MVTMNEAGTWFSSCVAFCLIILMISMPSSHGDTDPRDVAAINNLYAALGSPPLPGWVPNGGDPCMEAWQGVQCVNSNITAIILNGANLGGQLGDRLGDFASIITLDLSDNHIGGTIPENLPSTIIRFFVSANELTGNIPSSLAELSMLSDMSVNNNNISGELPDVFQSLTSLVNLDLSFNNLFGQLPPSFGNLSSLATLHVQNNRLSGLLDVLQDLSLKDLDIENNLFSGPVPVKLFEIPNFRKDGNPFNTTPAPTSMPSLPPLPFTGAPVPASTVGKSADGPAAHVIIAGGKRSSSTKAILCIALAVALIVVLFAALFGSNFRCRKSRSSDSLVEDGREHLWTKKLSDNLIKPKGGKAYSTASKYVFEDQSNEYGSVPKKKFKTSYDECSVDMPGTGIFAMPPSVEKVYANPTFPSSHITKVSLTEKSDPSKMRPFSFSSLQQYSNNFNEDHLIRDGTFGKIYLLELPNKTFLEAVKLDIARFKLPLGEFLELVRCISGLRHRNIFELVGYCSDHGQQILVYNHHSKRTLCDALLQKDNLSVKLSWKNRMQLALGVAKALEYLHEGCEPPSIHHNFQSANVFVDDDLGVYVAECGLASALLSNFDTQLSSRSHLSSSYNAPELNAHGSYSERSDVYSFGVVMLELLTGRRPYDSMLDRAEQHLVRWASSRLHDMNSLSRMVDPFIQGKYPEKSLSRFADIVSRCIQGEPEFRPPMSQVVQDLALVIEDAAETN